MRMRRREFRRVLDADDAFVGGNGAQHRGQQRCLARARPSRDEEGEPRADDVVEQRGRSRRDGARTPQRRQILGGRPQHAQ